jgi:hypothetical protein
MYIYIHIYNSYAYNIYIYSIHTYVIACVYIHMCTVYLIYIYILYIYIEREGEWKRERERLLRWDPIPEGGLIHECNRIIQGSISADLALWVFNNPAETHCKTRANPGACDSGWLWTLHFWWNILHILLLQNVEPLHPINPNCLHHDQEKIDHRDGLKMVETCRNNWQRCVFQQVPTYSNVPA